MAKKEADSRTKLANELKSLIDEIPEKGLLFLIDQANTIIYNMKIDEVNRAAERLQVSRNKNAAAKAGANEASLVRIAHTAKSKKAGREQLFRWLDRERDDVVIDAGLEPGHPAMGELYDYLKKHFSLKKE